jgi:hypothetical protein
MATRLNDLPQVLIRNYFAAVPTFIRGKPAMGKTETIMAFAEKMKAKMVERGESDFRVWTFYAPTMSPMDIQASAPNYETGKLDLYNNAALPNAYDEDPEHPLKGVVFFGELPNADPATIKLLQKYVNREDMSGKLRLPDGVQVIVDGNRIEDKSGVQQQGRAFLSRFEHIEVFSDAQDNINFAAKQEWHPNVQSYFKEHPSDIDNYDEVFQTSGAASSVEGRKATGLMSEEGRNGIWASMRSWARISAKEYVADQMKSPLTLAEMAGNLGSGVGAQYMAHREVIGRLASFDEVMADPESVAIPDKMDERYMLSLLVSIRCKEADLDTVFKFGQRLPLELQAVMLRNLACRKNFKLNGSAAYKNWIANPEIVQLINGR